MKLAGKKSVVICDFDGTTCPLDMGHRFLIQFTNGRWQEIDDAYCRGEIGSRQAYEQVSSILEATEADILAFARAHGCVDPGFPEFRMRCREEGVDVKIVSDGFGFYIRSVLEQSCLTDIPCYTNEVVFGPGERVKIAFPYASADCGRCGTCKRAIVRQCRQQYDCIVYVGNGHSDVCPSKEADLIFAKEVLYESCISGNTPCIPYNSFTDVTKYLL